MPCLYKITNTDTSGADRQIVLGPAPLQPLPPYYPPTPLPPSPPPPDPHDSPEPPLSSLYTHTHTHTNTPPQVEKEKQSKAMPHRAKAASGGWGGSRSLPDTPPQAAHNIRQDTSQHTALQSGVHPSSSRAEASTTRSGMKRPAEASATRETFLQTYTQTHAPHTQTHAPHTLPHVPPTTTRESFLQTQN
jgi:hypothetical protein